MALYVDKDSIYRPGRDRTVEEELAGEPARTQFGRAMAELGVELICANSPQAKGRVERRNGVFQDRLVKALRLEGISDLDSANAYLEESFLPDLNARSRWRPSEARTCIVACLAISNSIVFWCSKKSVWCKRTGRCAGGTVGSS